jgi:hypothetical protein
MDILFIAYFFINTTLLTHFSKELWGPFCLCRSGSNYFDNLGFASLTVWNMKTWKAMVCASLYIICLCHSMAMFNFGFHKDSPSSWRRSTSNYFSMFQSQREDFSSICCWWNDSHVWYPFYSCGCLCLLINCFIACI